MTRAIGLVHLTLVALASAGACSSSTSGSPADVITVTVTRTVPAGGADAESGAARSNAPSDSASASSSDTAHFGQAFKYQDGLKVIVGKPAQFQPGSLVHDLEDKRHRYYVKFQVTIINGSNKRYEQTVFSTTLQDGQREGEEIFDSEHGFDGSPNTVLLPGRSSKFKIGYGVDDARDLVMQVSVDFDHADAIFTS